MLLTFLLQMCILETLPSFPPATPPLSPSSFPLRFKKVSLRWSTLPASSFLALPPWGSSSVLLAKEPLPQVATPASQMPWES